MLAKLAHREPMNQGRPRDPPLHGSLNALEVDYSLSGVGDHFQDYLTACFEYQQPVSYSEEYAAEANDFLRVLVSSQLL